MCNIITCEQVSNGHPDKICDQIADAIVTDCLKHDKNSRVAIEVLILSTFLLMTTAPPRWTRVWNSLW